MKMLQQIVIASLCSVIGICIWRFLDWVWFKPRKMEKLLRSQGLKGNPYKFFHGDSKEIASLFEQANSKPIGFHDDNLYRVIPFIIKTVKIHGENSFAWAGPRPKLFIVDPETVRDVFKKYRVYQKIFKLANEMARSLVRGIAGMEGDEWSKSRQHLNPAFYTEKLKNMVPTIRLCCEDILNKWKNLARAEGGLITLDVLREFEVLTGSTLAQLFFSSAYTNELRKAFHLVTEFAVLAQINSSPFPFPGERYLPTKLNRKARSIDSLVHAAFSSMIEQRLKEQAAGLRSGDPDLLDLFLDELYQGYPMTKANRQRVIDEAVGQCKLFFFAGYDTTSTLLVWCVIMLSMHQDWQTRVREEVFQVLGNKNTLTNDDLNQLKYITMIMYEVLRLYPPVAEVSRIVEEDTKLGKYFLPKDMMVTLPIALLHRNTELWGEDAGKFNPERFSNGVIKASNGQATFMPFGWGPRNCIGQNFALLEAKTFLALLVLNFSFELAPNYVHAPHVAFATRPQYGAPVILRKL